MVWIWNRSPNEDLFCGSKFLGKVFSSATSAAAAAESLQSCPTLCDPIDKSPPGSPIPGILQARTLEWVAISFSNEWKWKVKVKSLSHVWLFAAPWTAAYQAPPSMGFSRQELLALGNEKLLIGFLICDGGGSESMGHWSLLLAFPPWSGPGLWLVSPSLQPYEIKSKVLRISEHHEWRWTSWFSLPF